MLTDRDYLPLDLSGKSSRSEESPTVPEPALAPPRYHYNNPKAYIGVVPAVATTASRADAFAAVQEHVIGNPDRAFAGAHRLNLIKYDEANHPQLTDRGAAVNRQLTTAHDSPTAALQALADRKRSQSRFCTYGPRYEQLAGQLPLADPSLAYLVSLLEAAYETDQFTAPYALPSLVLAAATIDAAFTVATFIRHDASTRAAVLDWGSDSEDVHLRVDALADPSVYRGTTTQQVKGFLYHCGFCETPGTDVGSLEPATEYWRAPDR